jgi:hypothetical protein
LTIEELNVHRVRLIHWKAAEAEERIERLQSAGFEAVFDPFTQAVLRQLKAEPPDAVVIDLGRLPSQGRDVALGLRKHKATRHVPLVFAGGAPEKVAQVKETLPDAVYAAWEAIGAAVQTAIAQPPVDPLVPKSLMDGYAGTPLPKKLGIKAGLTVQLVGAPGDFEATLGQLPERVELRRESEGSSDLILWFVRAREELEEGVAQMGAAAGRGGLWILWPKKASGVYSDLSQPVVRQIGLDSGLVDYKVCSVDAVWTGLRFTRRQGG